jgi:hypothetical protein
MRATLIGARWKEAGSTTIEEYAFIESYMQAQPAFAAQSGWHEFHDKFLSYGGPPLLRKETLGEEGNLL